MHFNSSIDDVKILLNKLNQLEVFNTNKAILIANIYAATNDIGIMNLNKRNGKKEKNMIL